jgi:hypothetical protein
LKDGKNLKKTTKVLAATMLVLMMGASLGFQKAGYNSLLFLFSIEKAYGQEFSSHS